MKVSELIELLKDMPQELEVYSADNFDIEIPSSPSIAYTNKYYNGYVNCAEFAEGTEWDKKIVIV